MRNTLPKEDIFVKDIEGKKAGLTSMFDQRVAYSGNQSRLVMLMNCHVQTQQKHEFGGLDKHASLSEQKTYLSEIEWFPILQGMTLMLSQQLL